MNMNIPVPTMTQRYSRFLFKPKKRLNDKCRFIGQISTGDHSYLTLEISLAVEVEVNARTMLAARNYMLTLLSYISMAMTMTVTWCIHYFSLLLLFFGVIYLGLLQP